MAYKLKYTGEEVDNLLTQLSEGGGIAKLLTEINYEELVNLRDAGELIPGMKYRITDYETFTLQPDTKSGGHLFDVVVTAIDNKTLSEDAEAMHSERDLAGYFSRSNLSAWKLKYRLTTQGEFAWTMTNKSIQFDDGGVILTGVFTGWFTVVDEVTWWEWKVTFEDVSANAYTANENPNVGDLVYVTPGDDSYTALITAVSNPQEGTGKGVIYQMTDEFNNTCGYDFKNIIFKGSYLPEDYNWPIYPEGTEIPEDMLRMMAPRWVYTFNEVFINLQTGEMDFRITADGSLGGSCYNNKINTWNTRLDRVIIFTAPPYVASSNNIVSSGCHDVILFGNYHRIGSQCYNLFLWSTPGFKVGDCCHDIVCSDHGGLLGLNTMGIMCSSADAYSSFTIENNCHNISIFHMFDSNGYTHEHIKILDGTHDVNVQSQMIDLPYNINYISADMNGQTKVWSPADEDFYIRTYTNDGVEERLYNTKVISALKSIYSNKRQYINDGRFPRIIVDMSGFLESSYSIYTHPTLWGGYIDSTTNQFKLTLQVHLRYDSQYIYVNIEVLEDGTVNIIEA